MPGRRVPIIGKSVSRAFAAVLAVTLSVTVVPSAAQLCPAAKQAGASTCCCKLGLPGQSQLTCCPSVERRAPLDLSQPRVERPSSVVPALVPAAGAVSAHVAAVSLPELIVHDPPLTGVPPPIPLR